METNSDLLTVPEVAQLLRLRPSTIRAWLLHRRLPHFKVGRRVFVSRTDALALLESSRVPAGRDGNSLQKNGTNDNAQ